MTLFANQLIKPKSMTWKGELVDAYPLYASVIYGNLTGTIKVEKSGVPILVTSDLEQLEEPEMKVFTDNFKNYVLDIVKKEVESSNGGYSLSGLGNRIKKYEKTVKEIIGQKKIAELEKPCKSFFSILPGRGGEDSEVLFKQVILATYGSKGIGELSYFEWMFSDGESKLRKLLAKGFITDKGIHHTFNEVEIEAFVASYDLLLANA